jgi:predicted dehydrogenase
MAMDGGGVLLTQAIHLLDLMLHVAGPVAEVQALAVTTPLHQMECEDFAAGGLRFASGAAGSVMATTATYPGDIESLVIDGTRANATLIGGQLTITPHDGPAETIGELSGTGGGADPMAFTCAWHRDLIASFAEAIRTGTRPPVTARDALAVHRLVDAMMLSAREGRRVAVA